MIVSMLLKIVFYVVSLVLSILFLPLKILLPTVTFSDGQFTNIVSYVITLLEKSFDVFAYFSYLPVFRLLFIVVFLNIFLLPLLHYSIFLYKIVIKLTAKISKIVK